MISIDDKIEEYGQAELDSLIASLPPWRRERAVRHVSAAGRLQNAVAFRLLQQAVRDFAGLAEVPEFAYTDSGKPFFREYPRLHFSLSHCDKAVACAVSDNPVGIDVETFRPFKDRLARYVCSDEEYKAVTASSEPSQAFIELWTRKESLCKLLGSGIAGQNNIKTVIERHDCDFTTQVNHDKGYVVTLCELK